jgi:Glyoxalase-like domain
VLRRLDGSTALAFQKLEQLPSATWPNEPHPQMLHLDLTVPNRAELDAAHQRALALGARVLNDRPRKRLAFKKPIELIGDLLLR